jgi:outer membrane protein TolC
MHKKLLILLSALIFCFFCFNNIAFAEILGYTNDKSLNLDDSIKLALLNNRTLIIANEEISMVKYKTDEALAYRFTQLDLLANYSHYKLEDPYYIVNNSADNFLLKQGQEDQHTVRFNLSQILYSGRRTSNTKKGSEVSLKKAKSEFEIIKNNVIYNTKLSFYKYLLEKNKLEIFSKNKKYIEKLNALKNESGINLTEDEINDFENFYNDFLFKIDTTNIDADVAKLNFFNIIGVEQNSLIDINGELLPLAPLEKDLDTCIAKALYLRPELLSSEASEELGFLEINISLAEKNPIIAFNASYQYSSDILKMEKDTWSADWHLGFNMNIPIFDGGTWIARNNQKKINLRKLKLKKSEMEENIKLDIKKAYMQYELSKKKLDYQTQYFANYSKNNKNFNMSENKKIITHEDWINCLKDLKKYTQIHIDNFNALYDYNKNNLNICFVMGDIS